MKIKVKENMDKRTVIICVAIMLVLAVGLVIWTIMESNSVDSTDYDYLDSDIVYYEGEEYVTKKNIRTLLIAGIDRNGKVTDDIEFNNAGQCDFISLIIYDNANETYKIMQINRDSMTDIPVLGINGDQTDTIYAQLALSHAYGDGLKMSCKNLKKAVSNYLYDVKIDDYAVFNMNAISVINDAVGGVEVTLNDDFTKYDKEMIKGKKLRLTGEQAVIFSRYRYDVGDNTNVSRMSRQQEYITALLPQAKEMMNSDKEAAANLFDDLSEYMVTSMNKSDFTGLLKKLDTYQNDGFIQINGESKIGDEFMEFYTDEDDLRAKVIENFYKLNKK